MLLWALLSICLAFGSAIRYDGYHGLTVGPVTSKQQAEAIDALRDEHDLTRQVLVLQDTYAPGGMIDMIVSPDRLAIVSRVLDRAGLEFKTITEDLQEITEKNARENEKAREMHAIKSRMARNIGKRAPAPEYYMRYDEMVDWLMTTVEDAVIAGIDVRLVEIGNSHEGRPIYLMEINADSSLPKTFIDFGIHAREWISPATGVWIIDQILFGTSADAVDMRTNYAWYFSTSINPDGYEFSHTDDRFWRKNREPNENSICMGTDLNRNWDANWGACGVSNSPCADTYLGFAPASCIETQNVMAALTERSSDLGMYITVHSYSQLWLIPWAGSEQKPSDYDELYDIAVDICASIEAVDGKPFTPGTVPDLLSCGAGGSFDWVKNGNPSNDLTGSGLGIKYAYAPELRPASAGEGGFDIPPENIPFSGAEIYAGVVTAVRRVFA